MKYLKVYEEFDLVSVIETGASIGLFHYLGSKVLKYMSNKKDAKIVRDEISNLNKQYIKSKDSLKIEFADGVYLLYVRFKLYLSINTNTNEVLFNEMDIKANLPKNEINLLVDNIKFTTLLDKEVENCFIDIIDEFPDFKVEVANISPTVGEFILKISKDTPLAARIGGEPTNQYYDHDGGEEILEPIDINTLRKCVKRFMNSADVTVVKNDQVYSYSSGGLSFKPETLNNNIIGTINKDISFCIEFLDEDLGLNLLTWSELCATYNYLIYLPFKRK